MEHIKDILELAKTMKNGTRVNPCGGTPEPDGIQTNPCADEACSICRGVGLVHPLGENGKVRYDKVVPCLCSQDKLLKERYGLALKLCELPAATEDWTLEKFNSRGPLKEAYAAALDITNERSGVKWLSLVGPVDTGKSHLAVAICRRWLAQGKPARYVLAPLMLEELRAAYNHEGEYERLMNFFLKVPLLALDDLGTQKPTEWAVEKLMEIIDYRYVNALHLVVTTNRPLDNLPGDTERRIGSRLLRAPFARVVQIDAPEYRLRRRT